MIHEVLAMLNSGRGEDMTPEMNQCVLDTCQETLKLTPLSGSISLSIRPASTYSG